MTESYWVKDDAEVIWHSFVSPPAPTDSISTWTIALPDAWVPDQTPSILYEMPVGRSATPAHISLPLIHSLTNTHAANPLLATISSTSASLLASETDTFSLTLSHWWGRRVTYTSLRWSSTGSCEHQRRLMMWFVGLTIMLPVITEMMMMRERDDGICVCLPHCVVYWESSRGSKKRDKKIKSSRDVPIRLRTGRDGPAVSSSSAAASDVTQKEKNSFTSTLLPFHLRISPADHIPLLFLSTLRLLTISNSNDKLSVIAMCLCVCVCFWSRNREEKGFTVIDLSSTSVSLFLFPSISLFDSVTMIVLLLRYSFTDQIRDEAKQKEKLNHILSKRSERWMKQNRSLKSFPAFLQANKNS